VSIAAACLLVAELFHSFMHVQNDFTPEEEEEVRRENQWAFD
jgi:hypothetical protein